MADVSEGYDVRDYEAFEELFVQEMPKVVVHLAAHHPLKLGERNPVGSAMVNVIGTLNLLLLARKYECKLIYASSGAVYGNIGGADPVKEEGVFYPESFYGVSKLAAEQYVMHFAKKRDLDAVVVRFSSVYGPNRKEGPINQMLQSAMVRKKVTIFGDGKTTRDYTYIDDVVDGLILCAKGKVKWGDTYNIASGTETSLLDVVEAIKRVVGKVKVDFQAEREGDIKRNYFDISKISKYGYTPRVLLKEGVERLHEYLRD